MKNLLNKFLYTILFIGVFVSCETSDPLIDKAQVSIYTQNFDSAYAALERSMNKNPESGVPYYYKALAHSEEAKSIEDPAERPPYYMDFRETIVTAREMFEDSEEKPDEAGSVDDLILGTWSAEHNEAIKYATDDSVMATVDKPLDIAIAHLKNAVIINPDSTLSFDVLSQVQYMNNNFEGAIDALEQSMELKNPPPADDYQRLAAFYVNTNQLDATIETLKKGLEIYPDSTTFVQNLADAYMQSGDRDESIEILKDLIEDDPDNPQYRLALGTQLLQATTSISDKVSANYDEMYDIRSEIRNNPSNEEELTNKLNELNDQNSELEAEINNLAELAENELQYAIELRPDDEVAYNALGIIYQNKAAALFDKRNYTNDNEEAAEYDAQAKEALTNAMGYYEKVVEINPENANAWQSLSSIYYTLDMREKAEEALEKAQ